MKMLRCELHNEPDITFDFNPIANPGKSEFGALWKYLPKNYIKKLKKFEEISSLHISLKFGRIFRSVLNRGFGSLVRIAASSCG